jgi:hypothetical protein
MQQLSIVFFFFSVSPDERNIVCKKLLLLTAEFAGDLGNGLRWRKPAALCDR